MGSIFCAQVTGENSLWKQLESVQPKEEKPIVVVIPSYNNKDWYEKNLTSVLTQNYKNYRIIYLDDVSTDGTGDLVEQYSKKNNLENKITLIKQKEKHWQVGNIYVASQLCQDNEIMVHLDGDDWLAHPNVFALLNKVYQDPNVWLTYGQYQQYPSQARGGCEPFPESIIHNNAFRQYTIDYQLVVSHLRTHYAGLFKLIKLEDLCHEGKFYASAGDIAFMLPLLEMVGSRIKFIPDVLYIYNRETPLNDNKVNVSLQQQTCAQILKKQQYPRLDPLVKSQEEKPIVVIIPSYNNKDWYEKNLDSVLTQNYKNYRIIYLDDVSTDGTADLVEQYSKKHNLKKKITLIRNKEKQWLAGNFYQAAQLCDDDEIMVHLHGDDWLAHPNVFALLNKTYQDPQVWLTYGQYQHYPSKDPGGCESFPATIMHNNAFRKYTVDYQWVSSHLRTNYAWLFKLIKLEDLCHEGKFFSAAGDVAFMLPLLEMAGTRVKFIPDVLYIYNRETPLNENKINKSLQQKNCQHILEKQKYSSLLLILPEEKENKNSLWEQLKNVQPKEEKPMVIVIPSYNNKDWYEKNLNSVLTQDYKNYRIIYLDDVSTDGTGDLVEQYIKKNNIENKITLIKNKEKQWVPGNFYQAAHLCQDNEIMVHLDGDDWLAHPNVLSLLNKVYQDPHVWLTYGQFEYYPMGVKGVCEALPPEWIEKNSFRYDGRWITSALRTHYAWLFKRIKLQDLQHEGKFYSIAGDIAFMLPLLEMAGHRIKFIPDVLYMYNRLTALNDDKKDRGLQMRTDIAIRQKPAYKPLKTIYLVPFEGYESLVPEYEGFHLFDPFTKLIKEATKHNYIIKVTNDISDSSNIESVVVFNPHTRVLPRLYEDLKKYPFNKRVLYVWEPPSVDLSGYDSRLKDHFGKIFTFRDDFVDNKHYFKFYYPYLQIDTSDKVPFNQKKFCSLFAANKCSPHPWEIYSERVKAIKFFDTLATQELDLYGRWWDAREYSSYKGFVTNKLHLLRNYKFNICYENVQNIQGYVTEKILDCFACSCVPIYWGAPNITEFIPANCFIDRRAFASLDELYLFLKQMDEKTYNQYLDNINKFVKSPQSYKFSDDYFIQQFFETLKALEK